MHDEELEDGTAPSSMRLEDGPDGVRAVPDVELPPLTTAQVRDTLEQTRLRR